LSVACLYFVISFPPPSFHLIYIFDFSCPSVHLYHIFAMSFLPNICLLQSQYLFCLL
jgi:hypothetical protein